jgi:hypothetical protein
MGWDKNDTRYKDKFRNEELSIHDVKPILLNMIIHVHMKNQVEKFEDFFRHEPDRFDNC